MRAEAGTRIKRHEAERLALGRLDDLRDIHAHRFADDLELIAERDVHGSKNVLGELHGFGGLGVRDHHHMVHDDRIKRLGDCARSLCRRPLL